MSVFFAALLACSTDPADPPLTPPIAAGVVCVDAFPGSATVTIAGQPATERCTAVEQAYSASVEVVVSAPGHKTHTATVGLTGTETLTVKLQPEAAAPDELTVSASSPPLSFGEVCVDAVPADATVTVAGKAATERCTAVEKSLSSTVEVVVSAPGHETHTTTASVMGGTETLAVKLEPAR